MFLYLSLDFDLSTGGVENPTTVFSDKDVTTGTCESTTPSFLMPLSTGC